jgi:hypothetical protein
MKRNRQRAKSKGAARVAKPRPPRYSTLSVGERAEYGRSVDLLYDLRHGEGPYTKLLRKHGLSSRKARRYLGANLLGGTRGKRVRPSKTDRLVRELWFPRSVGDMRELVRGLPAASKLSKYFEDRAELLGDDLSIRDFEYKWRGVRIDGRDVFADADAILRMADAGVLKMDNLYASVGPER